MSFTPEAPSDFEKLRSDLTARLKSTLGSDEVLRNIAKAERIAPVEGLSQRELLVLAAAAGGENLPGEPASLYSVKRDVEQAGLTNIGFYLGLGRLLSKGFLQISEGQDPDSVYQGDICQVVGVTEEGWLWIDFNESKFVMVHRPKEDDIPF